MSCWVAPTAMLAGFAVTAMEVMVLETRVGPELPPQPMEAATRESEKAMKNQKADLP